MDPIRETAGLTLRTIVRYVRVRGGDDAVAQVLALAGAAEDAEVYDDPRRWWSRDFKIRMFDAAATVFGDDDVAVKIGTSVLEHSLGTTLRLTLSLLGGPTQLLRLVSKANRKFNTCAEMTTVLVRRSGGVVSYRQRAGYPPDRHDCNYTRGLLTQIPAIFGLPAATVQHDVCEVRGNDECLYELRWRPLRRLTWFPRSRRGADGSQLSGAIANQLRALQATVAEVVGARNPERVLSAITERAAFAVNAHSFLLVVRISADQDDQAYGFGLSDAEMARLAASGRPSRPDAGTLVVDIVSPSRRYGYLVAYSHDDFLDEERQFLDAYAGLAAVALDAMSALDAAAERQQTAERLLTLAQSLTHARSVSEVASVTTETVRAVAHADVATMLLLDDEGRLSVVAHSGFPPSDHEAVEALVIAPQHAPHLFEARRARPDMATRYDRTSGDPLMGGILADLGLHHMTVVGIALPDHLYGVLVAGSRMERGTGQHAQLAARMSGVAKQAATVLRSRELLDQTWRLAHIDELTGLANRRAFMSELDAAVAAGPGALLFLDLDGFKQVNDTLGHAAGDELLAAVADRLADCARSEDTVARLGGDEFVVLLRGMTEPAGLEERAGTVREAFAHPLALSSIVTTVGASIGVTRYDCGELTEEVLRRADAAMYEAKRARQLATGSRSQLPALDRVS